MYDSKTRRKTYISTEIYVFLNEWSEKKGEVGKIIKNKNAIALNGKLKRIFRDMEAFALSDECQSIDDMKNWNRGTEYTLSVVSVIESELKRRNPSMSVLSQNKALLNMIVSFGKIKTFSDFTYENIIEFDTHLTNNGLAQPTAYKTLGTN